MTKRAKLTKAYVDRVKPGAKDEFHWDTELKGFGLRATTGGKVSFIVQGRVGGSGKEVRLTIGSYGVFTPDQARDVAREHLRTMRLCIDPRDIRRQDEATKITLAEVMEAYLARPGMLKESTKAATAFQGWRPALTLALVATCAAADSRSHPTRRTAALIAMARVRRQPRKQCLRELHRAA